MTGYIYIYIYNIRIHFGSSSELGSQPFSCCGMDAARCAGLLKTDAFSDKGFLKSFKDFDLGLTQNSDLDFRVYILECRGPRGEKVWYTGIVHFSELRKRMKKHFEGGYCHYTTVYPAQKLVYLCPAPTEAAEAYIYHEMLRRMDPNCAWKLGGFTQTSSKPSRLDCLLAEQARRGMRELCFNCGQRRFQGEHLRLRKCPHALRGVEYECPVVHCSGKLLVTSRGHAEKVPEPLARSSSTAPPPPQPPPKRPAPVISSSAQPPRKSARTAPESSSFGAQVSICQELYSPLSWFLKHPNPSKKQCENAQNHCRQGAVELSGAHVRALSGTAYAKKPPSQPKPLCLVPGGLERQRLGNGPVETEIAGLKIQLAQTGRKRKRLSQVLFRVDVLASKFSTFSSS